MITPERRTVEKARKDKRAGKAPTTQAGEFIHEEMRKVRRGEHGVRSPKQAIAIALSEARRAGVKLPPPKEGKYSGEVRKKAEQDIEAGEHRRKPVTDRGKYLTVFKKQAAGTWKAVEDMINSDLPAPH